MTPPVKGLSYLTDCFKLGLSNILGRVLVFLFPNDAISEPKNCLNFDDSKVYWEFRCI